MLEDFVEYGEVCVKRITLMDDVINVWVWLFLSQWLGNSDYSRLEDTTQHSKRPNRVTIVSNSYVGSVYGIDKFPMLRSMTKAKADLQMFFDISLIIGRG